VFGVVIIPRDAIVIEKRTKLVLISLETLSVFNCYFAFIIALGQSFIEALNEGFVLA
jgi:hypothetical protein